MGAARFFVAGVHRAGDVATLARDDARKALVVLRKNAGDALEIVDSSGRAYAATMIVDGDAVRASLERELDEAPAATLRLTLAQGIPKGQKMDFVVEKATELGVDRIVPFASERTTGGDAAREGKVERWRRLAKSAAQQCGRRDVPVVEPPAGFADVIARAGAFGAVFVPWELAGGAALRESLPRLVAGLRDALVVIGPEGGLAETEVAAARARGAHVISLGRRIFRTETAGLVACTALFYASGDL